MLLRVGFVSALLAVAAHAARLRQGLTNEVARPTHTKKAALLQQRKGVFSAGGDGPGVIGADPSVEGVVDAGAAQGGTAGLGNAGSFEDEVAPPPKPVQTAAPTLPVGNPTENADRVSMSAQPTQEIVRTDRAGDEVSAQSKGPSRQYDDSDSDANVIMEDGMPDPAEPKESITREDILTTTANREYKAAVQALQKKQRITEAGALNEDLEKHAVPAPIGFGVMPPPQLPAAAVAPQPRPVASLAAAKTSLGTTTHTVEKQQMAVQNGVGVQSQVSAAAHAQTATQTKASGSGVTRPKGWDQCLKFTRYIKSQDVTGVELVRVWKSTCEPAVQAGTATERYRLMCNALGGAVEPYSAQLDYNVEALCDSVLAVFHDVTAVDAKAR